VFPILPQAYPTYCASSFLTHKLRSLHSVSVQKEILIILK
jgi:hypothetical protein